MGPLDTTWRVLADPHRRQILSILRQGPRRAGELAQAVGLAPNAVSFHLRLLLVASLVSVERQGRNLWYHLHPGGIEAWQADTHRLLGIYAAGTLAGHVSDAAVSHKPAKKPAARTRRRKASKRSSQARSAGQAGSTATAMTITETTLGSQLPAELL